MLTFAFVLHSRRSHSITAVTSVEPIVAKIMTTNTVTHKMDIGLFSPYAVGQIANALMQLVENVCSLRRGKEVVLLFTIYLITG